MDDHEFPLPTTTGAAWYFLRVVAGTRLVALANRITRAAGPAEAVLVGAGHRVAATGMRWADAPDQLIEPVHPLARRVAGLPELPRMTAGSLGLCDGAPPDDSFRWLHGGRG